MKLQLNHNARTFSERSLIIPSALVEASLFLHIIRACNY